MITHFGSDSVQFVLNDSDVESAVRQFICSCHPDATKNKVINVKISVREKTEYVSVLGRLHVVANTKD